MQISLNWINEYVDLKDVSPEQIAHELTMSGLEVEEIQKIGAQFENIITAKIKALNPHPNADKLRLVTVDTGALEKTVVCGAQNIEVGQIVPYASIGSKVFSRKTNELFELTPVEIRGVKSEGMLCSADELALNDMNYQEEDGILILNRFLKDVSIGEKLEKVLHLAEDVVLTVAPTANRGDELSIIGIARELSAVFNRELNFSYLQAPKDLSNEGFEVKIIDEDTCKYYACGILKDVKIKPSPSWLAQKLTACGIRSISNVVDITNYVLLEYGQPLHAFDMDKLDGYLCVRRAKEGETIVTLDGVERKLTNDSVLIADREKGVCLAGVFGGENSEIDDNTKNIVLESAYFTAATNRRSSRSVGYRSEACARFERGIDIEASKPALMRAIQLLIELADAKIEAIVEDGNNKLDETVITLRFNQVGRYLGIKIANDRCVEILAKLGFELLGKNELAGKFKVPSFRASDVSREVDLIEEIARINGYDKIEPTLPAKTRVAKIAPEIRNLKKINDLFVASGFHEIITNSLIGENLLKNFDLNYNKAEAVKVKNAQSEDYTMLRQTLIGNVLNTLTYNFDNGAKSAWLYEIGKVYFKKSEATEKDSGVEETRMLSGVICGDISNGKWTQNAKKETDFYVLKGILEKLFEELSLQNRIKFEQAKDESYLHPGKAAKIVLLGKNTKNVGVFGELHPSIKTKHKITQDVYLFELNLDSILNEVVKSTAKYKKLAQFPEVQRDLAFIVPESVSYEKLHNAIKKSANSNFYKACELFDIYQGANIEDGYKSTAFRIRLQDETATLTDEKVDEIMMNIQNGLKKSFEQIKFRQ